jgi:hypothetical protein
MATQITENPSSDFPVEVLRPSMPDIFSSVHVSRSPQMWRRLLGFVGPGFLVAVGYMDPGNWATDLAAGSRYGYTLLFVVMLSNLMAILLQSLSLKLGIASEQDLAQACRDQYSRPVAIALWILAEIAIAACDLAEVIGSAIALQLLFHIPLLAGVLITSLDVLLILLLRAARLPRLEAIVIVLIGTIAALFGIEIFLAGLSSRPSCATSSCLPLRLSQTARCSTSASAFSARRSCRTISTCTPLSCRRAHIRARQQGSAKPSASPTGIQPPRSPWRSSST